MGERRGRFIKEHISRDHGQRHGGWGEVWRWAGGMGRSRESNGRKVGTTVIVQQLKRKTRIRGA